MSEWRYFVLNVQTGEVRQGDKIAPTVTAFGMGDHWIVNGRNLKVRWQNGSEVRPKLVIWVPA